MISINLIAEMSSSVSASAKPMPAALALGRGQKAARDFEAQLIATALESLEKTFAALPGQDNMAGQEDYNSLGNEALAKALAAGGGFGIAHLISQHLVSREPARTKVAAAASQDENPQTTSAP
jgi:Rod binding domain-containing protein